MVDVSAAGERDRLSSLERSLRLFTDIRPGEGVTGVVLFANVFLILCAYYLAKALRDGWIAVSEVAGLSSVELKAYTSFAQSLLLWGSSAYARLATRWHAVPPSRGDARLHRQLCSLVFHAGFVFANLPAPGSPYPGYVRGPRGGAVLTFAADPHPGGGERFTLRRAATAGATFGSP